MVKIGDNKYERSKRTMVAILILTMTLQMLMPFMQVAADGNDECIRMLHTVDGSEIYHIKEKVSDNTFKLDMQFAVSSKNTNGKTPVLIESSINNKLTVINASLVNKDGEQIAETKIKGNKVSAKLTPETRSEWIDEELNLIVTVRQNKMDYGEIIENNFKVSFDNKMYTSNNLEILLVKEFDFDIEKSAEILEEGNLIHYNVSHRIPSEVDFVDSGYNLDNSSIMKYKLEDKIVSGEPGLYKYNDIKVMINNLDVTNDTGLDIEVINSNNQFSISYSADFLKSHLGEKISVSYNLKTNHYMNKDELVKKLEEFGYVVNGLQRITNNATLNMGVKYTSKNGEIETLLNDTYSLDTTFNTERNITAVKLWPEENTAPYINENVEEVELILLANGNQAASQSVSRDTDWKYEFKNLPLIDKAGRVINYNLVEGTILTNGQKGNYKSDTVTSVPGELQVINKWKTPSLYLTNKSLGQISYDEKEIKRSIDFLIPSNELILPFEFYKYELTDNLKGYDLYKMNPETLEIYVDNKDVTNELMYNFGRKDTELTIEFPLGFLLNNETGEVKIEYELMINDKYVDLTEEEFIELIEQEEINSIENSVRINEYYKTSEYKPVSPYKTSIKKAGVSYKYIDIPVKKVWEGDSLSSVEIELLQDGSVIRTAELTEEDNWEYVFDNIEEEDEHGKLYHYEVRENLYEFADDYKVEIEKDNDGFVITNTKIQNEVEYINIPVAKSWVGAPLEKVTIKLYADGTLVDTKDLSDDNNWADVFVNVPKYSSDGEIEYIIDEEDLGSYTKEIEGNVEDGFIITNTKYLNSSLPKVCNFEYYYPTPEEETSIKITKEWVGEVGEKAEINLLANGDIINTVILNEDNNWTETITNLPLNEDGEEILYTVEEIEIPGYVNRVIRNPEKGFLVINTKEEDINKEDLTKTINVSKEWIGETLDNVTINLLQDGVKIKTATLSSSVNWKAKFEDLKVYKVDEEGEAVEYEYTIEEVPNPNYTSLIKETTDGFVVINVQDGQEIPEDKETFDMNIEKKWVGKKMSEAQIVLYMNNNVYETYVLNDMNNWKMTIKDLPITDQNEEEITYELREVPVDGYTSKLEGSVEKGFVFTNTEIVEQKLTSVKVSKLWIGEKLPEAKISLVANDNTIVETITLNDYNSWTHTFNNLPFDNNGEKINYTVMEHKHPDYDVEISGSAKDGFVVKNTKKFDNGNNDGEKIAVGVSKKWDGKKGEEATVALAANGSVVNVAVLNDTKGWSYIFYNLPKNDKFNNPIKYTILEYGQFGYKTNISGNIETGFVVTNIENRDNNNNSNNNNRPVIRPPASKGNKRDIEVSTKWLSNNKKEFEVNLIANGRKEETIKLSSKNNWKHIFTDLDVRKNGDNIRYTLEVVNSEELELDIKGSSNSGFVVMAEVLDTDDKPISNRTTRDLIVDTSWLGEEAEELVAVLFAEEEEVDRVTLSKNNWRHIFTDLPISEYEDSVDKILYTLEVLPVEGYEFEVNNMFENMNDGQHIGFDIIGYKLDGYDENFVNVHVRKSWVGKELSNATIQLIKNNENVDTIVLNRNNDWEYTFRGLPRFDENGKRNRYTIKEMPVKGYTSRVIQVEDSAYLVVNEEQGRNISDNNNNNIADVQTYDGGVMPAFIVLILSIVAFGVIEKKKK